MPDEWLTTKQAAQLTGYHRVYIGDLVRSGRIKARRFGQAWMVSRSSLLAYLKAANKSEDKRKGPKTDRA